MAKSKTQHGANKSCEGTGQVTPKPKIKEFDPALATLFQDSLGPVKSAAKSPLPSALDTIKTSSKADKDEDDADAVHSSHDTSSSSPSSPILEPVPSNQNSQRSNRKRKRLDAEDDVEGKYLRKLAQEEAKEQLSSQQKRRKSRVSELAPDDQAMSSPAEAPGSEDIDVIVGDQGKDVPSKLPQHESIVISKEDLDIAKSSRTVFLANVSTLAIKTKAARKLLLDHLTSFVPSLPDVDQKHAVESLRFRSTAFANGAVPRKAAFAKKELMEATTKSTNAYAVYTTELAAREAAKRLNGSVVLDRHLRVDSVAHPAKIDHRRCVFIGNLGFVDDMTNMNAAEDEENKRAPRKAKEPADVEEGLWRQFGKAGIVESVRVVRDKTTRVGKGFAYVQFADGNAVEKALLYNEKKFPPMLPRILRVTRAKNMKKATSKKENKTRHPKTTSSSTYNSKIPAQVQSMNGRAGKLLGRAGAAQFKAVGQDNDKSSKVGKSGKSPATMVFEGYRASRQQGKGALKTRGLEKSQGKPRTRSSRRGAEFKAKGGEKVRK